MWLQFLRVGVLTHGEEALMGSLDQENFNLRVNQVKWFVII